MVVELMGTTCTQIACGGRHTLTYVPSRGRLYSFGLGGSGQLGNRGTKNANVPQLVFGPWVSPNGDSLLNKYDKDNQIINSIFSGGDHSFLSTAKQENDKNSCDFRNRG